MHAFEQSFLVLDRAPAKRGLSEPRRAKRGGERNCNGGGWTKLLEPLIVVREYPFQWKRSAIDRSELAKLRNIEGWTHEEIGRHIGRSRSVVSRLLSDISTKGRRHAD